MNSASSVTVDRWAIGMTVLCLAFTALWGTFWVLALLRGNWLSAAFWGIPLALFLLMSIGWIHAVRPRISIDESGIHGLGSPRHLRWEQIDKAFVWDDFLFVSPDRAGPYVWLNIRPKYPNNVYVRKIDPAHAEALTAAIKQHRLS